MLVAGAIVVVDQLTKRWVLAVLEPGACSAPGACIDLVWTLRFNLVFNSGASFGTGQTLGPLIGIVSFAMAGVMVWLGSRARAPVQRMIYAAIAGGALGNGLDRLFRADDGFMSGAVVDFIDVQWWPVFNVADMAIVVSVIAAIALSFITAEDRHGGEADTS